ncbi:MAG: outer membrane beta-barrel protein [Taibaiella sp.]|nr:outer membrane beta-barrel protein [Taibaiella sp.]
MRKLLFAVFFLLIAFNSIAQKWYVRAGVGYAFPQAAQTLDRHNVPYSGSEVFSTFTAYDSIISYSAKKASFSSGFKGIVSVGYALNSHIALELEGNFGIAPVKYSCDLQNIKSFNGAYLVNEKLTRYAKFPVLLTPSLAYRTNLAKLDVYGRIGIALPVHVKIYEEQESIYQSSSAAHEDIQGTVSTQFSVGFAGAAGVSYKVSKNVMLWGEFNVLSLSLFAKELKITAHTLDGATATNPNVGTAIQYGFSGTYNSTQQASYSIPFSNMGINLGLTFYIK